MWLFSNARSNRQYKYNFISISNYPQFLLLYFNEDESIAIVGDFFLVVGVVVILSLLEYYLCKKAPI